VPAHAAAPTKTDAAPTAAPDTPDTAAAPASADAKSAASPAAATAASATATTTTAAAAATIADVARGDSKVDVATTAIATTTATTDAIATMRAAGADVAKVATAPPALQSAPPATIQVYSRMVERFDGRAQRFEVRLDPAELGRVDVRIEVGADKKVHAVLAAHDSAALTDLMRGQRSLERALQDAGLDLADGGLKFELSGDNGRSLSGNQQQNNAWGSPEDAYVWRSFNTVDVPVEAGAADLAQATRSYSRRPARLDVMA
jgi:flagellar hook-length control protein FliK